MKIEFITDIINSDTKEPLSLLGCPCGNKSFYITDDAIPICASCNMTHDSSQAIKDSVGGLPFS